MATGTDISGRAWAELALLALIWGGSFLAVEIALGALTPFWIMFQRVLWAAALLWLWVAARGLPLPRRPAVWGAFLVMGTLNNAIPFSLIAWAQTEIESGLAAILNASAAIFGVLVAAAVLADEKLTPRRLAGVAIGFAGVALCIGWRELAAFDPAALGQMAMLGAALAYAFASVWAKARLGGLAPAIAAAGMLTASTAILGVVALVVDGWPGAAPPLAAVGAVGYLAIPATAGAYLLYYRIVARAGAGNLLLVTLMVPPVAILLGWLVLGERLAPGAYAGFALIALGLVTLDGRALRWLAGRRRAL